jgi:hypothetical protein
VPLDRNAKVRVMMVARALMRHQEKGKACGRISEGAGGAHRASLALPQRRDWRVLPRHTRRSPRAAGCARSTVHKAIRALEQVDVLSWVNRIKRVREYVPRPVRQPGATTLRGARSPAALFSRLGPGAARRQGASVAMGRSNRENRGRPQCDATTLRGAGSPAALPVAWPPWRGSPAGR